MVNWKDLKRLIKIMEDNKLVELCIEEGETKIILKKGQTTIVQNVAPISIPQALPNQSVVASGEVIPVKSEPEQQTGKLHEIKSILVGTLYRSPKPGAPPFVEVNDKITKGQTLCIIEAMKVMNEIKSDVDGEIVEICAKDGEPVDFGKVLFKVKLSQ